MCGICGILRFDPSAGADKALLDTMTQSLVHRGPDDSGTHVQGPAGLGSRRLRIIDLSPKGHMPMSNDDGSIWIAFNGEIYDFKKVRQQLVSRGYRFRSDTDTEVVLKAYEEYGEECLAQFNGMFAFAIWDTRKQRMFLARDRVGIKPLYYARLRDRLLFASEIKALLADPALPRDLSTRGLNNYFAYGHAIAPDTILDSVKKLLPGHYAIASGSDFKEVRYWDADFSHKREPRSEAELAEEVRERVAKAVHQQMVADVPVGAFLSGGLDSSAVVAFMSQASSQPVQTFSVGFDQGSAYNELDDARRVAEYFKTKHHELHLTERDLMACIDTLVYHYDEPFGDAASFPTYLVARFASEHVKVCLSGEGGDEVFGGYRRHLAERYLSPLMLLPRWLRRGAAPRLVDALPRLRSLKKVVAGIGIDHAPSRYGHWLTVFNDEMRSNLFTNMHEQIAQDFERYYRHDWELLDRLLYMDLKTRLVDAYLEKVDKATMAVSIEARVPLLDHELIEFMASVPSRYKVRGMETKVIFRRALEGILPTQTLHKPKHGFSVPTDPWFRGKLSHFVSDILRDDRTRRRSYFNHDYVERLFAAHQNGRRVNSNQLWLLLNFELWHRRFLDEPLALATEPQSPDRVVA